MIWFTSDLHLFHHNILKYCNRPFKNVDDMHKTIIKNWNECVKPKDKVYLLGDVTYGNKENTLKILNQLNGTIVLIKGNHDRGINKVKERFETMHDYLKIKVDNEKIILFHYPILSWDSNYKKSIHLHGHCHGNLYPIFLKDGSEISARRFDVGVDVHGFRPVSLTQVKRMANKVDFVSVDHHKEGER